jgi:NTP pyrophosphatase (non-canonical NTP hydrolase)
MTIYQEVALERARQDNKWGRQEHSPYGWLTILGEETGEACRAALEGNARQYRKEMIQVAAVAIAAIECLDRKDGFDFREPLTAAQVRINRLAFQFSKAYEEAMKRRAELGIFETLEIPEPPEPGAEPK